MQQIIELVNSYVYLKSLVILVSFFIASKVFILISQKIFFRLAKKTKTEVDDKIVHRTGKPISLILLLIGVKLAIIPLEFSENVIITSTRFITSLIILVVSYTILMVLDVLIDEWGMKWAKKTKSTLDDSLVGLLQKTSKILILVIAFIYILDIWGVEVIPFVASLGIAGVAVAFALQDSLKNIFGGISLILDKSVSVGDVIELDETTKGTVLSVGIRSTKIKTFDNELITIPNGKLADSKIWNYAQPDLSARLVVPFNVAYGSEIDKVKKIVLKEIKKIDHILDNPEPTVRFVEMGDSALKFKLYLRVDHYSNRFPTKDRVNTIIYNIMKKNKISIPFPQLDVHLKKK